MRGTVVVDEQVAYQAWLQKQKTFAELSAAVEDGEARRTDPGRNQVEGGPQRRWFGARQKQTGATRRSSSGQVTTSEEEIPMADVALGASERVPPRRSGRRRALSSAQLVDDLRLFPGRQGHRHPVLDDGDGDRTGGAGAVLADAAAARISRHVLVHRRRSVSPVHHHARHDHGDLSADRAVPGRLRQLPDPADGGRAGHGVPLCQHAELLDLSARRAGAGGELLRAGRSDRRRLDPLSAAGHPRRDAGVRKRASF